MLAHRAVRLWILLCLLLTGAQARAEVNARTLLSALGNRSLPLSGSSTSVVVEHERLASTPPGLIRLSPHFSGLRGSQRQVADFAAGHLDFAFHWSPPRHLLLDQVAKWTNAASYRAQGGGSGKGVAIGIVDTGVDLTHPDLRNADGTTRVAWLLDFSRPPAGLHPDLEARFGCEATAGKECQVLNADDINAQLAGGSVADLPNDEIGHGTHVASLAAGNGLSDDPPRYLGSAPEATLIVVKVTRTSSAIDDLDILSASSFVFEQADALGMPVVENLSLGSDFGPHDGTSSLARGLADQLDRPGRAVVVAAGNSGILVSGLTSYPGFLGIHTEVFVPKGEGVRVPLLTPPPITGARTTNASVFVWIGFQPGSDLRLGLDHPDGPWITPIGRGESRVIQDGDVSITLLNNAVVQDGPLTKDTDGAVVFIDGSWQAGRTFVLRLAGEGTAGLWLQSEGDLNPQLGSIGAVFPQATIEQTINIPAAHPDLIAVGASVNRTEWPTRSGTQIDVEDAFGKANPLEPDSVAWFSSAGPMSTGVLKPDVIAPGAFVIGAMSKDADPKTSVFSMFSDTSFCGHTPDCDVVDDRHAVSTGTSMAAPIVSGAVALLFEQDPTLTAAQVKGLLRSGARDLKTDELPTLGASAATRLGPGMLDIVASSAALERLQSGAEHDPDAGHSEIVFASSYLRPTPQVDLQGIVKLRDAQGGAAGGFATSRLRLEARNATVAKKLSFEAPGLLSFELAGLAGSGGKQAELRLLFDDQTLLTTALPIAVDSSVADDGYRARGGCSLVNVGRAGAMSSRAVPLEVLLGLLLCFRAWPSKRYSREAPRARSQDRRDDRGRRHPSSSP